MVCLSTALLRKCALGRVKTMHSVLLQRIAYNDKIAFVATHVQRFTERLNVCVI